MPRLAIASRFGAARASNLSSTGKSVSTTFSPPLRARDHLRQPMVVLRADHQIDSARAPDDFAAFRLGDAAGDRDQHVTAVARCCFLHFADAADLGIDLFDRLFADVAGVEDDKVGVFGRCRLVVAFGRQGVRHTMGIVDVHLAAE